jgi:hypothetical protein
MSLWFEIAVLVLLAVVAASLVDICFQLESVNKNFATFGAHLEAMRRKWDAKQ